MDLLSGLPKEVAENLMEHSKGILEVDEYCEKHPRYKKMLLPHGETVCPVCYRDIRDGTVSKQKSEEYYAETIEGKKSYLYENSVVSNKATLDKGFKDFNVTNVQERQLKDSAVHLVEPLIKGKPINAYLQGPPGCGKSHLSMAVIKNVNEKAAGKRCLFMNFPSLQQKIRASFNDPFSSDSEGKLIQQMIAADILVLDDIANEINPSNIHGEVSGFSARILYAVMDARAENKPTIITSNIPWKNLEKLIDPRVYSRMGHQLTIIPFANVTDKRTSY